MSQFDFLSALRSSDHDVIGALRFLDDYATHVRERGHPHQEYRNFVPRFDLEQHVDSYQLYGELPGFRREDVIIEAHDDYNLQVSGSIRLNVQHALSGASKELPDGKAPADLHNGQTATTTTTAANQERNPAESHNGQSATTTNQERYPIARFGDELDQHAEYVKGPRHAMNRGPKVQMLISERHPSSFHRAFHFPMPMRKDQITATMQDGILHISAPRASMPPPVKIPVRDKPVDYPGVVV